MGTYSEVAIKIYGSEGTFCSEESVQRFFDLFDERFHAIHNFETNKEILYLMSLSEESLSRPVFDIDSHEQFVFYLDSVKWYSGVPAIDFFDTIFDLAKSIPGLNGEYLRVTEETEVFEDNFGTECLNSLRPVTTISGI